MADQQPQSRWPSPRRAWATVALLFLAYTLSFVDRQLLVLLIEPVQQDLGVSDVQFSLLSGLAFTFFYTLVGIPLASVADRHSRRNLIAISIFVWSVMTALCGLARSFAGLFLARIGVGIGEAGLTPAAYSMLGDSFPPERRGRAMATYTMGSNTGLGLALIVGGGIAQWALTASPVRIGADFTLQGWQIAFFLVSLPGPLLALLFLLVREPVRQEKSTEVGASASLTGFFRQRWRVFLLLCLGYTLTTVSFSVYLTWTPAFFGRAYGWNPAQVGSSFGLS